jgi:hypothetical protein
MTALVNLTIPVDSYEKTVVPHPPCNRLQVVITLVLQCPAWSCGNGGCSLSDSVNNSDNSEARSSQNAEDAVYELCRDSVPLPSSSSRPPRRPSLAVPIRINGLIR